MPDLILIDGGKGQLGMACRELAKLGLDHLQAIGLAKEFEEIFQPGQSKPLRLGLDSGALKLLQRVRDEAHRFAITTHRAKRAREITASPLDEIEGVGAKRKKALLLHFGSARNVARAGLADLEAVGGISKAVAEKIYGHFHIDQ